MTHLASPLLTPRLQLHALARNWWLVLLRGICAILFGVATMVWPQLSLVILVTLFGVYALADGFLAIMAAITGVLPASRWWLALVGVLGIAVGGMALAWPGSAALVLLAMIAGWTIAVGILQVIGALRLRKEIENEWLLVASGVLSVAFGLMLLGRPVAGALAGSESMAATEGGHQMRMIRVCLPVQAPMFAIVALWIGLSAAHAQTDPLASWNEGAAKAAIASFVARVTTVGSRDFVPPDQRIAVFDNDGTLWAEQPLYFQFQFALDRIKALAPKHPEWKETQPFKAVLEGDEHALLATGERGLLQIMGVAHTGMTTDEFQKIVADWIATAHHPRFKRSYTDLTYQPMLELLGHLRANGFKTFIVSGGGVEFMRAWAEKIYGIPPEQVVGSSGVTKFTLQPDGHAVLVKEARIEFVDDGPGKPAGINRFIGRRPIFAFGNSDSDQQMLEWTAAGEGARFMGIVHHTDSTREYAYDRQSHIGKLDKAWDEASKRGWTVVDMKQDWKVVFPFEK